MKILAIDDNKDNLIVLKAIISDAYPQATVYTALNGKDGIKLARAIDPDVILLDILMPEMDGYTVCRRIKNDKNLQHIPVVFLTALKTTSANRIKALKAGGDGFLTKPVNIEELIVQIRAMVKIKQAAQKEKEQKKWLEKTVAERTKALEEEIKLRIETEQQLRESEEKYRIVSNLTSDYIFHRQINPDGSRGKTWIAGSFKKITGYSFNEYLQNGGWLNLVHPDDIETEYNAFKKLLKNQKVVVELRLIHKTGKIVWVRSSGFPVWDTEQNKLKGIIGAVKDITKEKIQIQLQNVLFGISKALLTASHLQQLFSLVQQELNNIMDASNFIVVSFNEANKSFTVEYGKDEKELVQHFHAEGSLSSLVVKRKKSLFLKKKDIYSLIKKGEANPVGTLPEIWMGAPLYKGEKIYGVMMLRHYKNGQSYDKQYLQIFEAAANEISLYLEKKETDIKNATLSKAVLQNFVGTLIMNPEGIIEFANPAFYRITGFTEKEILGKKSLSIIPETHPENIVNEIAKIINEGKAWQGTLLQKKKDGTTFWVNAIISPVFDEKNQLSQTVALIEDITDTKRHELFQEIQFNIAQSMITSTTLRELFLTVQKELNRVISAKNIFIALYNPDTDTLTTQIGEDEKKFVKNIPPRKSLSGKVLESGTALLFTEKEIEKMARRGEIILVSEKAKAWLGAPLIIDKKAMGVIAVQNYSNPDAYDENAREIMGILANQLSLYIERKRTEEFNFKLSQAVAQSPASIVITDLDGTIEYVNPKFCEITGYSYDELIGQNPRVLKSGEHNQAFYENLWNTILSGKEWKGELHNKKKTGELYWENALISPLFNDEGEITHFLGVKEDITEKKEMLSELIQAKEKAEESDRLKTAFLQNMSHEIRTPLNGILGFAELILSEDVSCLQTRDYARFIAKSGNRLLQLINNILDISRIESGSIPIYNHSFFVNSMLQELCHNFRTQAKEKGVTLYCRFSLPDENCSVISDADKIKQILTNLLNNAIKFTDKGSITLSYKIENNNLKFKIKDTGRGIPAKYQKRIFDHFFQADMSISRGFEGAGLGLPISKGLVELLGGKIWFESKENKGTTFYFTIPLQAVETTKKNIEQLKNKFLQRKKKPLILIVEDDETGTIYLKTVLSMLQMEVLQANSGEEAIKICKENRNIDLVLMDIRLPGINGLDATRQIKALRPKLPVIAQTAHAFSSDRQAALESGCDDYIPKPVNKDKLISIMDKYL